MLEIISNIPLFVWLLFTILLVGGLKARKTNLVPLRDLVLLPIGFFIWSLFSFFDRYESSFLPIFLWIFCLSVGSLIGFLHIERLKPKCNVEKKTVEMPGSWIPLILSMSVFGAKFSIGMLEGLFPHLEGSTSLLGLEFFSSFILGIFAGRAAGCFFRYKRVSLN